MKSMFGASKLVSDGFHDALEDAKPNPYNAMISEMKRTRTDVCSERGEGTVSLALEATATKKLLDELELHRDLIVRIGDREKIRAEMDYYCKKVEELRQDREKRASKMKPEKESDIEKFSRNDAKYNQMRSTYQTLNAALIADLVERWNARVRTLGPALADFVQVEKQVLVLYASAVKDIPGVGTADRMSMGFDDLAARAEQAKRDATRQADAYAAQAQAQAAQAQEKMQVQMSGSNAALVSFAAGSAVSSASAAADAQKRAAQAKIDAAREAHAPAFEEFKMQSQASASDIFAKAKGISPQAQQQAQQAQQAANGWTQQASTAANGWSSQAQAQAAAATNGWEQPPMLSHITASGMGVGAAMGFSNLNTDGSAAAAGTGPSPRAAAPPMPPPAPPSQPVFYGSPQQPLSPPGGPSGGGGPSAPPPPPPVPVSRPSVSSSPGREGQPASHSNPFAED